MPVRIRPEQSSKETEPDQRAGTAWKAVGANSRRLGEHILRFPMLTTQGWSKSSTSPRHGEDGGALPPPCTISQTIPARHSFNRRTSRFQRDDARTTRVWRSIFSKTPSYAISEQTPSEGVGPGAMPGEGSFFSGAWLERANTDGLNPSGPRGPCRCKSCRPDLCRSDGNQAYLDGSNPSVCRCKSDLRHHFLMEH